MKHNIIKLVKKNQHVEIPRLEYRPASSSLDLEIFKISDLRARACPQDLRATHRYEFYLLICVTKGNGIQTIDFQPIECQPGSFLVVKPGQAHNLRQEQDWDGWMILFRPEFIGVSRVMNPDSQLDVILEELQEHLLLKEQEQKCVTDVIVKMQMDIGIKAPNKEIHALLRHQLSAFLLRLFIFYGQRQEQKNVDSRAVERFKIFQRLIEVHFTRWHQVAEYANQLGCSEKSLTRSTIEATGVTAKALIAARIILEAKRLLAHTDLSVSEISEKLGFDETTNFIKFFKRGVSNTPATFRLKSRVQP